MTVSADESSRGPRPSPERVDLLFSVLSHRRRRSILRQLGDDPRPVDELAQRVAADEGAASGRSAGSSQLLHVRTSLEHQHLPKLVHAGLVEWDRANDEVRRTVAADRVDPILASVARDDRREPLAGSGWV
jgi:hypothetical protein